MTSCKIKLRHQVRAGLDGAVFAQVSFDVQERFRSPVIYDMYFSVWASVREAIKRELR